MGLQNRRIRNQPIVRLNLLRARLKRFYAIFLAAKWCWKPLKKCDVVIYDASNADLLTPYFSACRVEVLSLRGESVHVHCLVRAMFDPRFWKGSPIQAYADAFITAASPKIVVTIIDNNTDFYSISSRFPHVTTVFLQNGTRGEVGDIFGQLGPSDQYHVDWMLVHNCAIGRKYKTYVSGNAVAIGSLKNNMVPINPAPSPNGIMFVSQFHPKPADDAPLWIEPDGSPIYWEQFFYAERKVIDFLGKWCVENNKVLRICGRSNDPDGPEQKFFADRLQGCSWEYVPRSHSHSAYDLIDAAEIVVTIDSTLGYEALGRGRKTAGLSCRVLNRPTTSFEFGWPAGLPHNGLFWTGDADEEEFRRVLDYLLEVNDQEWIRIWQQYTSELMVFDRENTRLVALIAEIIGR